MRQSTTMVKGNRKIGLGVMGFADLLFRLNIPYNSEEALETAEEVMGFIQKTRPTRPPRTGQKAGTVQEFRQKHFPNGKNGDACATPPPPPLHPPEH
jgi:ribonucleoside-diphosphate reductase alpha chain